MPVEIASVESTPLETTVTETIETPEPAKSISEHAAQFSPQAQAEALDLPKDEQQAVEKVGKFAKHRAPSQYASPDDVAEINTLTKELRTKEAELGKLDPEALSGSARVRVLKRQISAVSARLGELKPKEIPAPKTQTKVAVASTFEDKEPVWDDFNDTAKYPDPLVALIDARARWTNRKDAFESRQQAQTEDAQQQERQHLDAHHTRMDAFAKQTPDFIAKTQDFATNTFLPPVLLTALVKDDNGPAFVYYLAQHPDLVDELVLLTDQKPVSDASVAIVQRRLKQALSSQQTAQLPERSPRTPLYQPPKPPTPVRTGSLKTADEPPAEATSISEHARYYGAKR